MRALARLGDKTHGICTAHRNSIEVDGVIVSAAADASVNGRGIARVGDKVRSECGHEGTIISGSPDATVNGRGHARIGDKFQGTYTGIIISAATDTY